MKEVYIVFMKGNLKIYGVLETRKEAEEHREYLKEKYNSKFRIEKFNVGKPQKKLTFEELVEKRMKEIKK